MDFSFERPSIADLQVADVTVVIRYLTGQGKALSLDEFSSYVGNHIGVCFVFEDSANDPSSGYDGGVTNARAALDALSALGFAQPGEVVVYFAVDESIAPDFAVPYFQGVCSVISHEYVGIYGEGALCSLLEALNLASWFWQSESTSFPGNATTLPITHLQQVFNASPVPGTDIDYICKPDVGQYPAPSVAPPPPPPPPPPYTNSILLLNSL